MILILVCVCSSYILLLAGATPLVHTICSSYQSLLLIVKKINKSVTAAFVAISLPLDGSERSSGPRLLARVLVLALCFELNEWSFSHLSWILINTFLYMILMQFRAINTIINCPNAMISSSMCHDSGIQSWVTKLRGTKLGAN